VLDVVAAPLSVREELRERRTAHDVRPAFRTLRVPDGNDIGEIAGYLDAAAVL